MSLDTVHYHITNLSCLPSALFSLFFPSAALASFFFTEF